MWFHSNTSPFIYFILFFTLLSACRSADDSDLMKNLEFTSFQEDVNFLKQFTDIVLLEDPGGLSMIAVSGQLQARVMTSTSNGLQGRSYGWINRPLFESKKILEHINPYGGEERIWLGPEGGQFSIFFKSGDSFNLENWQTPPLLDTEPFQMVYKTKNEVCYRKTASITNYHSFTFDFEIERIVKIFSKEEILKAFQLSPNEELKLVGYKSDNKVTNNSNVAWEKQNGLLSIWLLGMFNPSDKTTVIMPFYAGSEEELGPIVNDEYFGRVPKNRLKIEDGVVFFKGDGKQRGKIGLSPLRAKPILGSYDAEHNILTIIKYNQPKGILDYVNSLWKIQDQPFFGDVTNSYNDGPPQPGAKPLGPFYELETSSPALALGPGESNLHIQLTAHFEGAEPILDKIAQQVLGVSINEINAAF